MIPAIPELDFEPVALHLSATAAVRESADTRKVREDLRRIGELLTPDLQDATSVHIRQWHANFTRALRARREVPQRVESDEARFRRILNVHVEQMQDLLRDPLTNTPLDRQAMLGNDGEVYGFQALYLMMGRLPRSIVSVQSCIPIVRNHLQCAHII